MWLKQNLKDDKNVKFLDMPTFDLGQAYSSKSFSLQKFLIFLPKFIREIEKEHKTFLKINQKEKYECIVSDSRFGIFDTDVPSFFIGHHIKFGIKGMTAFSELMSELPYLYLSKKFKKILIPDFESNDLSGSLAHDFSILPQKSYKYIGAISMVRKKNLKKDIDYFFSVSGPEPQRTVFEKKVLKAVQKLKDLNVVVTLGNPENTKIVKEKNLTIYPFLGAKEQEEIMNRSKLIITRSGYTTIMDVAEIEANALFIPTKGQIEQEYLAKYHKKKGTYYSVDLDKLDLSKDLEEAKNYNAHHHPKKTEDAVKIFLEETNL